MPKSRKLTLLTTAPDQLTAEMWREMLLKDGIPVIVSPGDTMSFMGVSPFPCRLMVADEYLEPAKKILAGLKSEEGPGSTEE